MQLWLEKDENIREKEEMAKDKVSLLYLGREGLGFQ